MPRYSIDRVTSRATKIPFLPVRSRIEYNICLVAHKSLFSGETRYIKNLLQPVLISSLRSSTSKRFVEPVLSRQITIELSFSLCAPRLYNQLPFELHEDPQQMFESASTKKAPEDSAFRLDQMDKLDQLDQQNECPMEGFFFRKKSSVTKKSHLCTGCKSFLFSKYSLIQWFKKIEPLHFV